MATKLVLGDVYQALATKTRSINLFTKAIRDGFADLNIEINLYTNSKQWIVSIDDSKHYFSDLQSALDLYNEA